MSKLKHRLAIRLLRFSGKLPFSWTQTLGLWAGRLAWVAKGRARSTTDINIKLCLPELTTQEQQQLSLKSLAHTGMTALEIPYIWEQPNKKPLALIKATEGLELVDRALASGKGVILLAPHLGNWELGGLFFSSRYRMAALYSPPKHPEFEDYMVQVRSRLGAELVPGTRKGLVRLIRMLEQGGVIGILPDQSPINSKGAVFAPFFGIEVRTMTLAQKLIQKSGARPLVAFAQRLDKGTGFKIVVQEAEPGITSADPVTAATALNQSIEAAIRTSPEQYQWEYKRLRHRPPGCETPYNPGRICREEDT